MSSVRSETPPWISIGTPELSAAINPLGAQLSVLQDALGRDLLWNGNPSVWSGRAPLLFPIVGSLAGGQYRLGERTYTLGRHGFARGSLFETLATDAESATFRLVADEASLAAYPYPFALLVRFVARGRSLTITMEVRNTGAEPMPASMGYHPGFCWPLPGGGERSAHCIDFECEEPAPVRRIDAHGLLTPELHASPVVNRRLELTDALFAHDVLIFDRIRSRSVTYGADGGPRIGMHFPDARYLGVWTRPGAPFVCIEPWQGITDPQGFSGDLRDKPGIFVLAPDMTRTLTMALTLL